MTPVQGNGRNKEHNYEDQQQEDQQDCLIDASFCNELVVEVYQVVQEYNPYVLSEYDHTCAASNDVRNDAWLLAWHQT